MAAHCNIALAHAMPIDLSNMQCVAFMPCYPTYSYICRSCSTLYVLLISRLCRRHSMHMDMHLSDN